jgi:long-chain acyl-CoA synthetase
MGCLKNKVEETTKVDGKEAVVEMVFPPAGVNVTDGLSPSVAFNPLIWLLWFFDFLVWLVYFLVIGWLIALIGYATRLPAGKRDKDGVWRSAYVPETELKTAPVAGAETAWDCFEKAFDAYGDANCMGTRQYLGEWKKDKKDRFGKKIFGKTDWTSYKDIKTRAENFGKGLIELGMKPSPSNSKAEFEASNEPDTLLLWEDTCADWMTTAAGAFSQSLVVATSYSTLGVDGVCEALTQCECPVVICNRGKVKALIAAREKLPEEVKARFAHIVYTNLNCGGAEAFQDDEGSIDDGFRTEKMPELPVENVPGLTIHHFEQIVKNGKESEEKAHKPSRETMAVVMYTSGSTGKPKGVLIAHKNLCASVAGMHSQFSTWGTPGKEVYIAYLPAAHILELVAEIGMLSFGAAIGYADPRSIASAGACKYHDGKTHHAPDLNMPPGAIQEFKPTVMVAVPKIWDILKKAVEEQMAKGSPVLRCLFEAAYAAQKNGASWRYCPLLNLFFQKGVGAVVGGRMKMGLSGGGPISNQVQQFCRIAFAFPLVQGYALTETTCAGCCQLVHDSEDGIVGPPISSVELKLEDCPLICDRDSKPYMVSDTKHWDGMECTGRGEVLIRGPSVSLGYYAKGEQTETLQKKTLEEFSSAAPNATDNYDWFHTGDIGLFTPDGRLRLVDRKKNLVKLKGGEYIAIEQMEAVYGTSKYVDAKQGGIMVHGDGNIDKPVAIVQANMFELHKWAKENSGPGSDTDEFKDLTDEDKDALCVDPKAIAQVLKDFMAISKDKLAPNEKLCAVALISGTGSVVHPGDDKSPWTPENGFLTASNKIDRNSIKNGKDMGGVTGGTYQDILQELRVTKAAGGLRTDNV